MIEIPTRAIITRIRISATEIRESQAPGAFAAAVRQDWAQIIDDWRRRDAKAWREAILNEGRAVDPWLRLPEGL